VSRADKRRLAVDFNFSSIIFSSLMSGPVVVLLDRRVDRFDDAQARVMIAVRGDAFDVFHQEVTEQLHLEQALPTQGLEPSQEIERARSGLGEPIPQDSGRILRSAGDVA
jgi:hypothetical protein